MFVNEKWYRGLVKSNPELTTRAGHLVDILTHGRASARWGRLTNFQQNCVREAVTLMVAHFAGASGDGAGLVESYSLGDMRVWNRRRSEKPWETAGCGFLAWNVLMKSGLMRGVM
ncbi:MAG: hypothetical protein FWE21_10330 [Defluviitaleaceae bacterium]|nr:hypothetical protein [Defluviitaleaceae bacterium]